LRATTSWRSSLCEKTVKWIRRTPVILHEALLLLQGKIPASSLKLRLDYLHGTVHLWTTVDLKPAICSAGASTANTNQRRLLSVLNPSQGQYYANINALDDGGTQSYNAMLLSIQRRLAQGLTFLGNYTFSHCIGVPQNYELTGVTHVESNDRNVSIGDCLNVDRRHILNISMVAQSPRFSERMLRVVASDWKLSVIANAQTGTYGDHGLRQWGQLHRLPGARRRHFRESWRL